MKRLTQPTSGVASSGHPNPIINTSNLGFGRRLSVLAFAAALILCSALRLDATSIQITADSAQNYSRTIVRTTSGNIYTVIADFNSNSIHVYESSNGGTSWVLQDSAHSPGPGDYSYPSAAIDGNGIIHIAYWNQSVGLRYVTFSTVTNTFSGSSAVVSQTSGQPGVVMTAIAVDSNNASHIVYADEVKASGNIYTTVTYINNVGSTWNTKVQIYGAPNKKDGYVGDILVNQNNVPQISYLQGTVIAAAIGNANKATSFTSQVVNSSTAGIVEPSIVMDSANNTWISYLAGSLGSKVPALSEHRANDPWSTWQTPVQDATSADDANVALSAIGTTLYIAYSSGGLVAWQSFNGSSWSTIKNFDRPCVSPVLKWSEYFNNGGSNQIDVLITEPYDPIHPTGPVGAYWNLLGTTISSILPTSGPIGTSVTVNGSSFGPTQGTGTMTFNGVTASVSRWNDGSITATVPPNATTGPVVVTANGLSSSCIAGGNCTFTVSPGISALQPNSGQIGASVTINGTGFGSSKGSSTVTFNGVAATTTTWSTASITTSVPTSATTGPVVVTVGSVASNPAQFTVLGAISGTVTNAGNGTGISGASVQILQANVVLGSATTITNGSYVVSNVTPGAYDVRFLASGFGTAVSPGNAVVGGSATIVNAALTLPGTILGRVTQSDGVSPISGATVSAGQGSSSAGSSTTDGSGNYSLSALGTGTYTVVAAATGFASQVSGGVSVTSGNTSTKNFSLATGTQSAISYFYDELGRLTGASDSQGNTAAYSYDAVGNLLSISVNPSSQVSIVTFDSIAGHVGAAVTISGTGFSTTPSQNTVTFNGTAATVTSASSTQLVVTVPTGATTGPIQVTAPGGSASSSSPFTVQ